MQKGYQMADCCKCSRSAVGVAPDGKHYCENCTNWKMHRWYATHLRQQREVVSIAGLNSQQMERIEQMRQEGTL